MRHKSKSKKHKTKYVSSDSSESDSSSSDTKYKSKSQKKKRKNKSGMVAKASDDVVNPQIWPHTAYNMSTLISQYLSRILILNFLLLGN